MTYHYFLACKNIQEVKLKYKELAKKLHPDMGGTHEKFVGMSNEYQYICDTAMVTYPIGYSTAPYQAFNGISAFEQAIRNAAQSRRAQQTSEQQETQSHLNPEELQNLRNERYFGDLRKKDNRFDTIDGIIQLSEQNKSGKIWGISEMNKMDTLNIAHFNYYAWKTKLSLQVAQTAYKNYLHSKMGW